MLLTSLKYSIERCPTESKKSVLASRSDNSSLSDDILSTNFKLLLSIDKLVTVASLMLATDKLAVNMFAMSMSADAELK